MKSWRKAGTVAVAAFLVLLAACAGRPGSPALEPEDVAGFDPALVIDVLPKDGIPAVTEPEYEPATAATWLTGDDPVVVVALDGRARAYPLAILVRHEIVNDDVGGRKIAVTYCPLCNTAIVYEREVDGRTLTFGVSGKLYHSDLVMYDRQTESLWPQVMGVAVAGEMKGERLRTIPSAMSSFAEFRASYPDGNVLKRPPNGSYGSNPYVEYDSAEAPSESFFRIEPDARLPAMERVVAIADRSDARAYPYSRLQDRGNPAVVADRVGSLDVVIFWGGSARSALDAESIADGRRVGSAGVFEPSLDGRRLSFVVRDGRIVDEGTETEWSLLGVGLSGRYEGRRLAPVHHLDAFWFAWSAFVPHTTVWQG